MTRWIVSRSLSRSDLKRGGAGLVYHIQARTADQLCSFATLCSEKAPMTRIKAADGVSDVFTCMSDQGHTTMNVVEDHVRRDVAAMRYRIVGVSFTEGKYYAHWLCVSGWLRWFERVETK